MPISKCPAKSSHCFENYGSFISTILAAATAISENEKENDNIVDWLPHIITCNKHLEINGQCDRVMLQDAKFAEGLGRHSHPAGALSYIKSVAIKIGNDVLEIEGSSPKPKDEVAHYWSNDEYEGELNTIGGFPVDMNKPTNYHGKGITIDIFNEFIRFKLNGDESVFRNTVGLLGDYKTRKTLARDGATEMLRKCRAW